MDLDFELLYSVIRLIQRKKGKGRNTLTGRVQSLVSLTAGSRPFEFQMGASESKENTSVIGPLESFAIVLEMYSSVHSSPRCLLSSHSFIPWKSGNSKCLTRYFCKWLKIDSGYSKEIINLLLLVVWLLYFCSSSMALPEFQDVPLKDVDFCFAVISRCEFNHR